MNKNSSWQYLILVNFVFPIVFIIQQPPTQIAVGGLLILIVAALYLAALKFPRHTLIFLIAMLSAIVALGFLLNPMYMYLSFITSHFLGKIHPKRLIPIAVLFGMAAAAAVAYAGWFEQPAYIAAIMPVFFAVCILPFIIRVSGRYREMAIRLEAAQSQIERLAQDAERRRIAGELHDTLGHTLTFIALKAELASKIVRKDPDRAVNEMEELRSTARTALKQMRELVSGMRIVKLSEEAEHCKSLFAAAGIDLVMTGNYDNLPCPVLHETILALGLREAVTNVVRHSRASTCSVHLQSDEGSLRLIVEDDGIGFGKEQAAGTGWSAMKERLQLIDGTFAAEHISSGGTRIILDVPLVIRSGMGVSV